MEFTIIYAITNLNYEFKFDLVSDIHRKKLVNTVNKIKAYFS